MQLQLCTEVKLSDVPLRVMSPHTPRLLTTKGSILLIEWDRSASVQPALTTSALMLDFLK